MIEKVEETLEKKGKYMNVCAKARKVAESRWLESEDNINKYFELYNFPYADSQRKLLNAVNNIQ